MADREETFNFWVPAQLVKGGKDAIKDGKRWIQGIASTNAKDLQGEIVDQNGIDFSYFLKHGYFNNDHKAGFENKVGQPTEAKITKNGMWVKGFLFKDHKVADSIWELINSLSSTGANRKVGFSIQGKVLKRNGSKITKCWIQDVAITPAPVNTTTWAEIAKSLSAQDWDLKKDDDDREDEEKALAVSGGHPLVPEALEGSSKEDRTSKSLTFEESVDYVKKSLGVDKDAAEAMVRIAFSIYGEK